MGWTELTPPDRHRLALLATLATVVGLTACSVIGPRGSPLPQDGPNLVEVYRDHMATEGAAGQSPRERLPLRAADDDRLAAQRRADLSPLQQRFQRLPNPDLVMYVFPHLARGRYPVPGYVTVFPMYETVEYAMPGEVFEREPRSAAVPRAPASAASAPAPKGTAKAAGTVRVTSCRGGAECSL